jgi:HEAT repeat protein
MYRLILWSVGVMMAATLRPAFLSAEEKTRQAVEEWEIKGILAALKDEYPGVRERAARKLVELLGPGTLEADLKGKWKRYTRELADRAVPELLNLLSHEGPSQPVVEALVQLKARDKALEALRKLVSGSTNADIRFRTAKAWGWLGDNKKAETELRQFLKEPNYRLQAAKALGQLGAQDTLAELRPLILKDPDPSAFMRAAQLLGVKGSYTEATVRELRSLPNFRVLVARILGRLGDKKEALAEVRQLLDNKNIRTDLIGVLIELGTPEAVEDLRKLIDDSQLDVRRAAVAALGVLRAKEAADDLLKLLDDPLADASVRRAAVAALGQMEATQAVAKLRALLRDKYVRAAAAEALGRLRAKEVVDDLRDLLKNKAPADLDIILPAIQALTRLKADEAVPDLCKLLTELQNWMGLSSTVSVMTAG